MKRFEVGDTYGSFEDLATEITLHKVVLFHPWCPDGRAGGGKKFVRAVSQKP